MQLNHSKIIQIVVAPHSQQWGSGKDLWISVVNDLLMWQNVHTLVLNHTAYLGTEPQFELLTLELADRPVIFFFVFFFPSVLLPLFSVPLN